MNVTLTCNEPGCFKSFTKPSKERAELALRMHRARVHKKTIFAPGQIRTQSTPIGMAGLKPKRVYTRRVKQTQSVPVNFCPRCGTNIQQVALAVAVAGTIRA